ncbi:AAA family ATPase [Methylomonas sp. ZR1]|uniref:AAA family ATPase n=1 Tax=Methylomonas sp. ZR1 TaxID=1797072 RepID=UPI00149147A0|nr:AAA family ATPase [Methylomonas sp. ZR1]NOV31223.1 hypothetical protein [Methylomonas sp. ZR1]
MTQTAEKEQPVANKKIACQICGALIHSVQIHIRDEHPDYTVDQYKEDFPDSPLLSEAMEAKVRQNREEKSKIGHINSANVIPMTANSGLETQQSLSSVFKLGSTKAALNGNGDPIMITVFARSKGSDEIMIPDIDENFVFDIDILKNILLGFAINRPILLWGHAGTGKSSLFEQVCARTNRPLIRVQHTIGTEESHIVGQWTVRDGATVFELGPLAVAMKEGHIYMADEYDFGMPSVLAVYQSVLEGKSLVIKEADAANRVIRPHPNFRFVATGNTNGIRFDLLVVDYLDLMAPDHRTNDSIENSKNIYVGVRAIGQEEDMAVLSAMGQCREFTEWIIATLRHAVLAQVSPPIYVTH